jgi:hypothetical protein
VPEYIVGIIIIIVITITITSTIVTFIIALITTTINTTTITRYCKDGMYSTAVQEPDTTEGIKSFLGYKAREMEAKAKAKR